MVNIRQYPLSARRTGNNTPARNRGRPLTTAVPSPFLSRPVRVVLWLLVLGLISFHAAAAVNAHVDRNPVPIDESLTLVVETDSDTNDEPDFSVLRQDFDVLSQSSSTSLQIINGHSSRRQQWQVMLMPKHVGKMVIPAFSLGGQSSQPLTVTVTKARQAQSAKQGAEVFLQVDVEPKQAYVQQQITYTARLYRSVNLASGSHLSEPQFTDGDAIIKRLGDDREFQTTVNGVQYAVIERKYVIFPQKSGHFTLKPLVFNGQIIDQQGGRRFMLSPFNPSVRHKRVRSKAVTVDVQGVPAGVSASPWLPASKLQLQEQWSDSPPTFTVGEPVTRTLAIIADGLTAAQLPDLKVTLPDGIKSYPDQPTLNDTVDSDGITGVRQQKIALIPTRPGPLVLPAVSLTWWNTQTGKPEVARLPQRRIDVRPAAQAASATTPPVTAPGAQAQGAAVTPATDRASAESKAPPVAAWWPWLTLALGCGWLATVMAWWYQRRVRAGNARRGSSRADTGRDSLMASEQALKKACRANDPHAAKTALLDWAMARWSHEGPTSLTALAKRCPPSLATALKALDRVLYAPQETAAWQGSELWSLFNVEKPRGATSETTTQLEPLYRQR
jgi:hypothetical protein